MRKILVLSLAIIILLGMMSGGTFSYFSSPKNSSGNTFTAWICPYGSMIIVSDTSTMVTEVSNASITPQPAVPAWEHGNWDSPAYNNVTTYFTGLEGTPKADWIWETYRTDDPGAQAPIDGRVVRFERTFDIPCSPNGATLHMTVDNGYAVWINSHLVGCAQVEPAWADPCIGCCEGWETSGLTESFVHTDGWDNVETYTIPASSLVAGTNTLVILAANEQMDGGTAGSNPAGLIYWLKAEWGY